MKIEKAAEKLGFFKEKDTFVKRVGNYEFYLIKYKMNGSYVGVPMIAFASSKTIEKDQYKRILKAAGLRSAFKESILLNQNAIIFGYGLKANDPIKMDERLRQFADALKTEDIYPLNYCPYCGKEEDTDDLKNIDGILVPVHKACLSSYVEHVSEQLELSEKTNDHMLKSILLTVLFGFFGIIPSYIILSFTGFYSAWLFLIIPFAAFYGFKLGKAQKRSYVIFLIAAITMILAPAFMLFVYYDAALFNEMSFVDFVTHEEVQAGFISDMIMTVVFSLIAVLVSWKTIFKQTNAHLKKQLKSLK
ncbi:MAG: hypothetical protein CVV61_03910 [Tenericutes bacterium HGW-Tenericutes-6]|nr:MAG: hypothetical protein CVV61_03910 [Tenericutes bacterium HGW-Tenericutes-6]